MRRILGLFLFASLALAGCESDPMAPDIEDAVFNPSLEVDLDASTRTITGLYFRDIEEGEGAEARPGTRAHVHYAGYLVNGSMFDASEHAPWAFDVGGGPVSAIPGFDQGVTGMKVGGTRQIVVPPSLGYGSQPRGPIPANSILVFNIELVDVE